MRHSRKEFHPQISYRVKSDNGMASFPLNGKLIFSRRKGEKPFQHHGEDDATGSVGSAKPRVAHASPCVVGGLNFTKPFLRSLLFVYFFDGRSKTSLSLLFHLSTTNRTIYRYITSNSWINISN